MAFTVKNEDIVANNKQHLNLSVPAYEVILSDMFTFGEDKLSGFINTVFSHYYPTAEASISRELNRLEGKLFKLLSGISGDKSTRKKIIDRLIAEKREALVEKTASYDSGIAFKFWLNKENLEYLSEADSECGEEAYYAKRGKYIKCVLEEYARLPYVEREIVYFTPFVETIRYAVREEKQLRIVTGRDSVYSVYPYEILCDPLSTANYLVGFCRQYGGDDDGKQPCSFRISALKSVKAEKSKSAFLREDERRLLAQKISSRGVQFMVGSEAEIQVKLTAAGIRKYQRQAHLRPVLAQRREENIFVFQCTRAQAEFYFFKFGRDAEILAPRDLREKFRLMYEGAAETYGQIR